MKLKLVPTTVGSVQPEEVTAGEASVAVDFYSNGPTDMSLFADEDLPCFFSNGLLSREEIHHAIESLRTKRALENVDDERASRSATAMTTARCIRHQIEVIANDLASLGDYAFGNTPDVNETLALAHEKLRALSGSLAALREPYVQDQLHELDGVDVPGELKLHLGCGPVRFDGWVNFDLVPGAADVVANARWGLPFPDDSAKYAYSCHMFEHMAFRHDAFLFLEEVCRVLKPGAVFRVVVPDAERVLRSAILEEDQNTKTSRDGKLVLWLFKCLELYDTRLAASLAYLCAGDRNGFFGHKFGYDYDTLKSLLEAAGFTDVVKSTHMGSRHPELRLDPDEAELPSLYVEAQVSI